jgi:lipopolysaccharide-induced tumor necrosis factor-alpha factor
MLATVVNVPPAIKPIPIVTKDGVIAGTNFGDVPARTVCPQCRKPVMTLVEHTIGLGTWLIALVLLLLPPLCFIPFFIKSLKDVEHKCPNCGNIIGVKKVVG